MLTLLNYCGQPDEGGTESILEPGRMCIGWEVDIRLNRSKRNNDKVQKRSRSVVVNDVSDGGRRVNLGRMTLGRWEVADAPHPIRRTGRQATQVQLFDVTAMNMSECRNVKTSLSYLHRVVYFPS